MLATLRIWNQIIELLKQKMGILKIKRETQKKAVELLGKDKQNPLPAAVK